MFSASKAEHASSTGTGSNSQVACDGEGRGDNRLRVSKQAMEFPQVLARLRYSIIRRSHAVMLHHGRLVKVGLNSMLPA